MFKTRITEMLGIKYPILCGGMQWLSRAAFVAEICNAGGKGKLVYNSGDPEISPIACGQVVGAIDKIKTDRAVIEEIITEAGAFLSRLNQMKVALL
jgi:NAD(P)H-dependent flavin oxidoreductase YrpB (nitropropane dioxygenase family)